MVIKGMIGTFWEGYEICGMPCMFVGCRTAVEGKSCLNTQATITHYPRAIGNGFLAKHIIASFIPVIVVQHNLSFGMGRHCYLDERLPINLSTL